MTINLRKLLSSKAFSLVEILGGVAVVLTLSTVAVVGIKDTVTAGQKAAAQQEIKQLNTALNNYKSAGGVVPSGYQAGQVLDLLKEGVPVEGSEGMYTPLVSDPPMEVSIAGDPYSLTYDENTGFSYEPTSGEGLGLDGGSSGSGTTAPSYPFDIEDDAATQAAMEAFAGLEYGDAQRQSYLDAFNAANSLGYLNAEELTQLEALLAADDLVMDVNGEWVDAPFNYTDAGEVLDALTRLNDIGPEEYAAYLQALKAGALANPEIATEVNTALVGEYIKAVNGAGSQGISWSSLITGTGNPTSGFMQPTRLLSTLPPQQINIDPESYEYWQIAAQSTGDTDGDGVPETSAYEYILANHDFGPQPGEESYLGGLGHPGYSYNNYSGINLQGSNMYLGQLKGSNFTGARLPTNLASAFFEGSNLSGQNLSGSNLEFTVLSDTNLTGAILPANLEKTVMAGANLSGMDLSMSVLPKYLYIPGSLLESGTRALGTWNLINSGTYQPLTGTNLTGATLPSNLAGVSLSGAILGGQDFSLANLSGTNLSYAKNLAWTTLPTNLINTNLRGTDLSGKNFSGYNLSGANLHLSNVNYVNFTGATISATTRAPNNTQATLDASGNGTWFGKTVTNWVIQP